MTLEDSAIELLKSLVNLYGVDEIRAAIDKIDKDTTPPEPQIHNIFTTVEDHLG